MSGPHAQPDDVGVEGSALITHRVLLAVVAVAAVATMIAAERSGAAHLADQAQT